MQLSSKELKRIARQNLTFHYLTPILAFFITSIVSSLLEFPFSVILGDRPTGNLLILFYLAEFLILLVGSVFTAGQYNIHLHMARREEYSISLLFSSIFFMRTRLTTLGNNGAMFCDHSIRQIPPISK